MRRQLVKDKRRQFRLEKKNGRCSRCRRRYANISQRFPSVKNWSEKHHCKIHSAEQAWKRKETKKTPEQHDNDLKLRVKNKLQKTRVNVPDWPGQKPWLKKSGGAGDSSKKSELWFLRTRVRALLRTRRNSCRLLTSKENTKPSISSRGANNVDAGSFYDIFVFLCPK